MEKQKKAELNEVVDLLYSHPSAKNQKPTKKEIEKEVKKLSKAADHLNRINQKFRFKNRFFKKLASFFRCKLINNSK